MQYDFGIWTVLIVLISAIFIFAIYILIGRWIKLVRKLSDPGAIDHEMPYEEAMKKGRREQIVLGILAVVCIIILIATSDTYCMDIFM